VTAAIRHVGLRGDIGCFRATGNHPAVTLHVHRGHPLIDTVTSVEQTCPALCSRLFVDPITEEQPTMLVACALKERQLDEVIAGLEAPPGHHAATLRRGTVAGVLAYSLKGVDQTEWAARSNAAGGVGTVAAPR
jgi:hypothetical protein